MQCRGYEKSLNAHAAPRGNCAFIQARGARPQGHHVARLVPLKGGLALKAAKKHKTGRSRAFQDDMLWDYDPHFGDSRRDPRKRIMDDIPVLIAYSRAQQSHKKTADDLKRLAVYV